MKSETNWIVEKIYDSIAQRIQQPAVATARTPNAVIGSKNVITTHTPY